MITKLIRTFVCPDISSINALANAFIEEISGQTKVRINFVITNKKSDWYGQTDREDNQVLTPEPYQNAFEKIENAVFIRSSS